MIETFSPVGAIIAFTGSEEFSVEFKEDNSNFIIHWTNDKPDYDEQELNSAIEQAQEHWQREQAMESMEEFAENLRRKLARGAGPLQVASWANKAERARRFLAGEASDADSAALTAEAQARDKGESAEQLAHKQLAREASYAQSVASTDGMLSAAKKQIAKLPLKEIQPYVEQSQTQTQAELQDLLASIH